MYVCVFVCEMIHSEDIPTYVTQEESRLATLELEYELQSKITSAAHRLAHDKSTSKYVRKQRRQSYTKAAAKVTISFSSIQILLS